VSRRCALFTTCASRREVVVSRREFVVSNREAILNMLGVNSLLTYAALIRHVARHKTTYNMFCCLLFWFIVFCFCLVFVVFVVFFVLLCLLCLLLLLLFCYVCCLC
jgi:hypothetical protein